MAGIAFFDVDKTLLAVNSARLWVRRELKTGRLSTSNAVRAAMWTMLYELGFARIESVIEDAIRTLKGEEEKELIARVDTFFEEEVVSTFRPGALEAVQKHRSSGDTIALLTSSSSYLARRVGETVGADHNLSNQFETDGDGLFTGRAIYPLCFGPGKLVHAERLADELSVSLDECSFYTDSYSDLPVMEKVGHPVAIHPDPRLRRAANRRGWRIELWGS